MTTERAIDPIKADYTLADGGDFDQLDDLANEVYKRWVQIEGDNPLEPKVGRPRRERLKDTPTSRRLLVEDCRRALQPIIDSGRAESIEVYEVPPPKPRPGWMFLRAEVTEAGGRTRTYHNWVEVS